LNRLFSGLNAFGKLRLACFSLLLAGIAGCHPAALVVPSYIKSVGVELIKNQTSYYGLDTIFTQALIRQFQVDGRLPLETADQSDLAVRIVIKQYIREPQFYAPTTNYVLEYRLSVVYDLAAVDQREKKTFLEDTGKVHSIYFYTPQYTGAVPETEDQAVSQLATDMAYTVVRRVLEGQ
jgi:hypothetical protein